MLSLHSFFTRPVFYYTVFSMFRKFFLWIFAFFFLWLTNPAAAAQTPQVFYRDGLVTMRCREVPLEQAMEALADAAGIGIYLVDAAVSPVSVDMVDTPVAEALRLLLRGTSYAAIYGHGKSASVVIYPGSGGARFAADRKASGQHVRDASDTAASGNQSFRPTGRSSPGGSLQSTDAGKNRRGPSGAQDHRLRHNPAAASAGAEASGTTAGVTNHSTETNDHSEALSDETPDAEDHPDATADAPETADGNTAEAEIGIECGKSPGLCECLGMNGHNIQQFLKETDFNKVWAVIVGDEMINCLRSYQ